MKLFKKLIILSIIFFTLSIMSFFVFVRFYGKNFIEESLKSALRKNVVLEEISYQFPLSLRAQNIRIAHFIEDDQFFKAKNIIAQLSPSAIIQRRLIFDSVVFTEPVVVVEKIKTSKDGLGDPMRRHGVMVPRGEENFSAMKNSAGVEKNHNKNNGGEVTIRQFVLKQGHIQYSNSSIDKDFSVAMENVYLRAEHLVFPVALGRTNFNISGHLIKKGNPLSGSSVEGSGWVDIVKRDMEAKILVIEADGSVGMTAEAVSKNNDMKVRGEVKFQNIFMKTDDRDPSNASAINNLISNAISSAGVAIGAKFSFKTKMDDFRPERVSFSGNVLTK